MALRHAFSSAKSDGGDATIVRPSNWNAAHVGITQTEVDFGSAAVSEATFTITDTDVSASSNIIAALAYVAPTGKEIEEVYMEEPMKIVCAPGSGQFDMLIQTTGDVSGKFKINYLVG
jgi:hypothetical protein